MTEKHPSSTLVRPLNPLMKEVGGSAGAEAEEPSVEVREANEMSAEVENCEEIRAPRVARRPYTPSKTEVEAHYPLHLEYRSWCPHCRAGRGISMQHRYCPDVDESHIGVTWSLDYCFMTPEDAEDDMHAILIVYDHSKHGLWALAVDRKGADESVVKWLVEKVRGMRVCRCQAYS